LLGDLIKKDGGLLSGAVVQDSSISKALSEKRSKCISLLGNSEALKLLRESQTGLSKNLIYTKAADKKSGKY
jgi:hypothetical protein